MDRIKVLHVVTHSMSTVLMRGQFAYLKANGFDPAIVSSPGPELAWRATQEGCQVFGISMKREIAPLSDLRSLFALWRMLRRIKPAICNSGTPKAGLLGGIAGWIVGVPCRVYTLRGLRLETAKGWRRTVLALAERVACLCAHRVICVSASLRDRAVALGLVPRAKTVLLGSGSSNGVDTSRFERTRERAARAAELRQRLQIGLSQPVIGFAGRLTRDKGVPELVTAFRFIRQQFPEAVLLLVGDYEAGDPVPDATKATIESDFGICHVESTSQLASYYHAMNVFVLPTYREGMPNTVLEAQAAGLPVVTTTATGAVDAVVDGLTGLLTPAGDANKLADAVISLLLAPERAQQMGRLGRERVLREFRNELAWEQLASFYRGMLREREDAFAAHRSLKTHTIGLRCKRTIDWIAALCVLVILSPILLLIALAILGTMGRPILFRQVRPGEEGNPFTLIKFRTMTEPDSAKVDPSTDATRLTKLGLFLRRFSLDELPQLWNVLKGKMSLVGPRPLLMEYLDCYTEEQKKRHCMKPGITGLAQTKGRNAITWEDKFYWDVWYVEHWNLWLDILILVATIERVIRGEGVSKKGYATTEKFGAKKFGELPQPASQPPVFVYGAGGHGKVVADILRACGTEIEGFIDDDPEKRWDEFGLKVSGDGCWLAEQASHRPVSVALGVGNNSSRCAIAERCARSNVRILTAVHPSATIAPSALLSAGVVIMAHAVVNPDATIGPGAIINTASIVEHDCRVGSFAHLSPRVTIGGGVEVADLSWLGMGSTVLPGLRVGTGSIVGADATVLNDVDDWVVVVGRPARIVKELVHRS